MRKNIVLTLTGHDKIGIVDDVTKVLVKRGGNVEASRMARLGGEFVMLMLFTLPDKEFPTLGDDFQPMRDAGYQISLLQTEDEHAKKYAGWLPYEIEVLGMDHDGIIHRIAHHLATQGINIENMDTSTTPAPMSGTPLFTMNGIIVVPPQLSFHQWSDALEEIGNQLNVNIKVSLVK